MLKVVFVLSILLQSTICRGFVAQPKIVNGHITSRDAHPFFVNVLAILPTGYARCGGAILNERWIATAAHCLKRNVTVQVLFGVGSDGEAWTSRRVQLANQHIHPEYSYTSGRLNDIGLIELHEAVRFDQPFSRPANLPTTCKRTPDNSIVFAVGNGQIDSRHLTLQNTTLRQAVLRTLPHKDCAQVYTRNSLLSNPSMVICVESIGEGGVFSGDSGGPLIRREDGKLIGIASFISVEGGKITRQIFTDLTYYFGWISAKTGLHLPKCCHRATKKMEEKTCTKWLCCGKGRKK